ncbi:hypothetical protein [Metabacillus schmidteae]|uniref:hypothetical protein n=1 Tax=Metabacillus schmidteae TaxID=2730405 RepID=UPI00158957D6|nr:hypothetical protein [Metabacillus schmidteae]
MDTRIKELIDLTEKKFGLENYYLHSHDIFRRGDFFNNTIYTLCMEWFPNHETVEKDGSNPDGTAVIEIDIHSHKFTSAIFVKGKTYAHNGVAFANSTKNEIIKWIEQETDLVYEKQFKLRKEEERELHFMECIDGVAVSPSGYIELRYNEEGKLTYFSNHGQYPSKEMVIEEDYSLTFEKVKHLAKEQVKLLEYPSHEEKRLFPIFAVEEIYIRNDQTYTIPFEFFADVNSYKKIEQPIHWDEPLKQTFDRKELNLTEEVTVEQAYASEPSPDSFPITNEEQEKCIEAVRDLLRQKYPNETGKWILKTLHREKGYIHAALRANKQDKRVFQRKLMVMIDAEHLHAVNYMDNLFMLEMFNEFQEPEKIMIEKEEAFDKLKDLFMLKPYHVYDFDKKQYVLCGKVDCDYGVNAATGEVIALNDL